jgi:hypothetical protein
MTTIRRLDSEYLEIDNLLRRLDTGEFDRQFASAEVKAGVRAALDERMLTTFTLRPRVDPQIEEVSAGVFQLRDNNIVPFRRPEPWL